MFIGGKITEIKWVCLIVPSFDDLSKERYNTDILNLQDGLKMEGIKVWNDFQPWVKGHSS